MKTYKTFDDIEYEMNKLQLEREIAWEELKGVKNQFHEDLKPMNWVNTAIKFAGRYGIFVLLKKIIKN